MQAFIRIAEKSGCDFSLLKEVEKINQHRVEHFVEKIRKELWVLRGKNIALWGLAFKPNTDDVRFAPSIAVVKSLLNEGATVRAYDPEAMEKAKSALPEITYCSNPYEAAEGADAIVIVTEWDEFRQVNWDQLRLVVERPLVIDGRNMFDETEVTRRGFQYVSVGRPAMMPGQLSLPMMDGSPSKGRRCSHVNAGSASDQLFCGQRLKNDEKNTGGCLYCGRESACTARQACLEGSLRAAGCRISSFCRLPKGKGVFTAGYEVIDGIEIYRHRAWEASSCTRVPAGI